MYGIHHQLQARLQYPDVQVLAVQDERMVQASRIAFHGQVMADEVDMILRQFRLILIRLLRHHAIQGLRIGIMLAETLQRIK